MDNRMTFAVLLWAAMGAANMTQAELARRVKVKRSVVSKWISGVANGDQRRKVMPGTGTLARILAALPKDAREPLWLAYLRERGLSA